MRGGDYLKKDNKRAFRFLVDDNGGGRNTLKGLQKDILVEPLYERGESKVKHYVVLCRAPYHHYICVCILYSGYNLVLSIVDTQYSTHYTILHTVTI